MCQATCFCVLQVFILSLFVIGLWNEDAGCILTGPGRPARARSHNISRLWFIIYRREYLQWRKHHVYKQRAGRACPPAVRPLESINFISFKLLIHGRMTFCTKRHLFIYYKPDFGLQQKHVCDWRTESATSKWDFIMFGPLSARGSFIWPGVIMYESLTEELGRRIKSLISINFYGGDAEDRRVWIFVNNSGRRGVVCPVLLSYILLKVAAVQTQVVTHIGFCWGKLVSGSQGWKLLRRRERRERLK